MWPHDCLIDFKICRTTAQWLHIDTPLLWIQTECFQSPLLAEQFYRVNILVSAIVSSSWIAFGVLVRHGRAEGIENGSGGDIFGSNQEDRLALALNFLLLFEGFSNSTFNNYSTMMHTMISETSGSDSTSDFSINFKQSQQLHLLGSLVDLTS